MSDHLRRFATATREVLVMTVRAGEQHDLMLFAGAMSYSLVLSLAPLAATISVIASRLDIQPHAPIAEGIAADLNAEALFGDLSWAGSSASIVAVLLLLWGASSLFTQLAKALARIWHQPASAQRIPGYVRHHLFSFVLLGAAGIALFASALLGTVIGGLAAFIAQLGEEFGLHLEWIVTLSRSRVLIDFFAATVLFLVAFSTVPKIRPRLRDVAPGAVITGAAYALGQVVLTFYLASAARFSIPGVLGALLGFLVWVYYTATIVLWGSELAYQIARRRACARGGADVAPYLCE
jgi:membrane protein